MENHTGMVKGRLYSALGDSAMIARICSFDDTMFKELRTMVAEQPRGDHNRRYVENGSDVFSRVCRYVFARTNHTNVCRYAHVLREAEKAQITPADLPDWLKSNGGVNALYYRRPLNQAEVATKVLRLTERIEFPRDRDFTITLRWTSHNMFAPINREDAG